MPITWPIKEEKTMATNGKADKFRSIAERRVSNILKQVRLVGNLSNHASYDYTPEQINKIFKTIRAEVDATEDRFTRTSRPHVAEFTLD
jgi:hypothetical protein